MFKNFRVVPCLRGISFFIAKKFSCFRLNATKARNARKGILNFTLKAYVVKMLFHEWSRINLFFP